jgi:hypothetical protein
VPAPGKLITLLEPKLTGARSSPDAYGRPPDWYASRHGRPDAQQDNPSLIEHVLGARLTNSYARISSRQRFCRLDKSDLVLRSGQKHFDGRHAFLGFY